MQVCIQASSPPQSFGHDTLASSTAARIKITAQYFMISSRLFDVKNSNPQADSSHSLLQLSG